MLSNRTNYLQRQPWLFLCLGIPLIFVVPITVTADDYDRPPVNYRTAPANNAVSRLQKRLDAGDAQLRYQEGPGYLRSLLGELGVPTSSQILVFSKTSMQRHRIEPAAPRALYFSDDVYVGFCQLGSVLEISAVDPQLGVVFYTLDQEAEAKPRFTRQTDTCLECHGSSSTRGFPGHLVRSVYSDPSGLPILSAGTYRIDPTSPLDKRWGGWYVTGTHGRQVHLGNMVFEGRDPEHMKNIKGLNVTSLKDRVDTSAYLTRHSDIVALMVLEHQTDLHNQITRANFLGRQAVYDDDLLNKLEGKPAQTMSDTTWRRIRSAGDPLLRALLFCGEVKLTDKIEGTSGFAAEFARQGPRDSKGRSLRDLDLQTRMFKYPCSYLVYSEAFDGLPDAVKDYVWRRLWYVLSGRDTSRDFDHLSAADRQAILEILLATKKDLPGYWRTSP
jgi:hypothetical protein